MKKFQKVLTVLMAAAMAASVSVTAFAADDGTTKISGSSNTGNTDVEYKAEANENPNAGEGYRPAYIVEIPATVTLSEKNTTEATIKIHGKDDTSHVFIASDKYVNVALTASQNSFYVKDDNDNKLSYTITNSANKTIKAADSVATCEAAKTSSTDLTFSQLENVEYAGTYTDKLTFTVSLQTVES